MDASGRDRSAFGLVQVMGAAALWATVGVASRMAPSAEPLSDVALGVSRMAVGGPVILVLAFLTCKGALSRFLRLDWWQLTSFAIGCAVFQVCLFRAFSLLGVTATVFLTVCLPPLLASGWSLLRDRQAVSRPAALALGLAVAGLFVFAVGTGASNAVDSLLPGLALAVVASVAFVVMTAGARNMTRDVGPLIVAGAGLTLAGFLMLVGMVVVEPQALAFPEHESWKMLALTLYLGLGPTALGYVIYCSGMARCRSTNVGLIASMVEPGLAALLAWVLLSERLGAAEMLGCGLVAGAMVLLWWSERFARVE